MIVETGHYALVLALALALMQFAIPLAGARVNDVALMRVARPTAIAQFLFVALAYGALTYAHVVSDFSLVNVIENSHSPKPLIYKISGVWGNHEGSMLLWVLILALFGALIALFGNNLPPTLKARADALSVQASIGAAFLLFSLLTSNPFARLDPAPPDGNGLNPILQDPGLAIHPPLLYLGYVGFSIAFSFAIAALIEGRIDAAWARWVRPVDALRLDVSHPWHRDGLLVGLLHARLGRLVVLGSGRERVAHAVARRHRAAALRPGDGKARSPQDLDGVARNIDLLAVADRAPSSCARAC